MKTKTIVTRAEWLVARRQLLEKEKAFTRLRDELTQERQQLPWVKVDQPYNFETPQGVKTLSELFKGKKQLIIYHFMFGPDWKEGCPSCSFWADNLEGIDIHLQHRDTQLMVVSRASLDQIKFYKDRMGWSFEWVSSEKSAFNYDFHVSYDPIRQKGNMMYNFREKTSNSEETPGISVFIKDDKGQVFHSYTTQSRGLDMMNGAYHYLDLTPMGRNEDELPFTMAWLRRRDQYETT